MKRLEHGLSCDGLGMWSVSSAFGSAAGIAEEVVWWMSATRPVFNGMLRAHMVDFAGYLLFDGSGSNWQCPGNLHPLSSRP